MKHQNRIKSEEKKGRERKKNRKKTERRGRTRRRKWKGDKEEQDIKLRYFGFETLIWLSLVLGIIFIVSCYFKAVLTWFNNDWRVVGVLNLFGKNLMQVLVKRKS